MLESASIRRRWAIIGELVAVAIRADMGEEPVPEWRWRHLMAETLREEQKTDGEEVPRPLDASNVRVTDLDTEDSKRVVRLESEDDSA